MGGAETEGEESGSAAARMPRRMEGTLATGCEVGRRRPRPAPRTLCSTGARGPTNRIVGDEHRARNVGSARNCTRIRGGDGHGGRHCLAHGGAADGVLGYVGEQFGLPRLTTKG